MFQLGDTFPVLDVCLVQITFDWPLINRGFSVVLMQQLSKPMSECWDLAFRLTL